MTRIYPLGADNLLNTKKTKRQKHATVWHQLPALIDHSLSSHADYREDTDSSIIGSRARYSSGQHIVITVNTFMIEKNDALAHESQDSQLAAAADEDVLCQHFGDYWCSPGQRWQWLAPPASVFWCPAPSDQKRRETRAEGGELKPFLLSILYVFSNIILNSLINRVQQSAFIA